MSESKKYTINTVEDFLLIPENKLEKCLDEFKIAMVASLHMRNLYESVDKSMHGQQTSKLKIGPFIWSDDEEVLQADHLKSRERRPMMGEKL